MGKSETKEVMSGYPIDAPQAGVLSETRKPGPVSVIRLTEATPGRRLAASFMDVAIIALFALVLSIVTFQCYVIATANDFDGPPSYKATGDWFAFSLLGSFALLFSTSEIFFQNSIGKALFAIRIEGRKRSLRWFVKWLPLLVFAVIAWIGYGYMQANQNDYEMEFTQPFHRRMLWMVALVPPLFAILLAVVALFQHQYLHDRLAGTVVVRPDSSSKLQAFAPIMHEERSDGLATLPVAPNE